MGSKKPFLTLNQAREIVKTYPTPFHIYDEAGIRRTARALKAAFGWNPGFREYFAVKATPNPFILKILHEEGCGLLLGNGIDAERRVRFRGTRNHVFLQ